MALLEVIGVGSIMPFLSVVGNPDTIQENDILRSTYQSLNFKSTESFINFLGLLALLMLFVSGVFRSLTSYFKFRFSNIRRHTIGQRLLIRYLRQPYEFFLNKNSSDISKVILSEIDLVIGQSILPALNIITFSTVTISLVLLITFIDFKLALITFCSFFVFYFIMFLTIRKLISRIGKKRNELNSLRFKITNEIINGIKELKVLGKENSYLQRFNPPSFGYSHYNSINQTVGEVPQFIVEIVAFGTILVMTLFTIQSNNNDLGQLLPKLGIYALGALKIKPAINNVYNSLTTLRYGEAALDNIIDDWKKTEFTVAYAEPINKLTLNEKIVFNSVSFKYYESNEFALKNINFEIKKNTTVGIIGHTGSGKSTLIDIILGLLLPTEGTISIDNFTLNDEAIRGWQNNIGYVPQSNFFTDSSIIENIAFGLESDKIDFDQVVKSAKMAQIHDFILSMPNSYQTIIGERGIKLSGGQRQRIAIARALYNNPEILILDEATSALDNETELEVMKAIEHMSGERTIIMIAHRLSTLKKCDKIIELNNGQIV